MCRNPFACSFLQMPFDQQIVVPRRTVYRSKDKALCPTCKWARGASIISTGNGQSGIAMTVGTNAEYSANLHSWLNEQQVERERLLGNQVR
jgi:hypothetical protein